MAPSSAPHAGSNRRESLTGDQLRDEIGRYIGVSARELRRTPVRALRKIDALIFDHLTGTLRREFGFKAFHQKVLEARAAGEQISVLMLDADGLKRLNDTIDYAAGDALIVGIIDGLDQLGVPREHVARFGGDEFIVLLPGVDAAGARQLRDALSTILAAQERSVSAGIVGIAEAPDFETMLRAAETQLHLEKKTRSQNRDYQPPEVA